MAHDLHALLGPLGVISSADLARRVDRHTIAGWVRGRRLLRPHPGVLALPDRWDAWATRAVAGVLATDGALSSFSALTAWRAAPPSFPVHVSIPAHRRAVRSPGLVVHRVRRLDVDRLGPHRVTTLPRALVDSWATGHGAGGRRREVETSRGAVIATLRDRRVRVPEVRAEIGARPALPGRRALVELLDLVQRGCQSELEIWGVRHVLRGPGMPRFVQQHRVDLPTGTVALDAAVPALGVGIELDGAAFHGDPEQRERDLRRDSALAARGWIVLRFSYRRLTREPDACRREIIAACRARELLVSGR